MNFIKAEIDNTLKDIPIYIYQFQTSNNLIKAIRIANFFDQNIGLIRFEYYKQVSDPELSRLKVNLVLTPGTKIISPSLSVFGELELDFSNGNYPQITIESENGKKKMIYTVVPTQVSCFIGSVSDFDILRDPNNAQMACALSNDIDFKNQPFKPLPLFSGTLQGNNFTLSNLKFETAKLKDSVGLFYLIDQAIIRNLHFENVSFSIPSGTSLSRGGSLTGRDILESELYNISIKTHHL